MVAVKYPTFPIEKARHQVTVQGLTETPDQSGGYTQVWADKFTAWAAIEDFSLLPRYEKERWSEQQLQTEVSQKITIRYQPNVTARDRVLYGSRVYAIIGVINPLQMNVVLHLMVNAFTPEVSQ